MTLGELRDYVTGHETCQHAVPVTTALLGVEYGMTDSADIHRARRPGYAARGENRHFYWVFASVSAAPPQFS